MRLLSQKRSLTFKCCSNFSLRAHLSSKSYFAQLSPQTEKHCLALLGMWQWKTQFTLGMPVPWVSMSVHSAASHDYFVVPHLPWDPLTLQQRGLLVVHHTHRCSRRPRVSLLLRIPKEMGQQLGSLVCRISHLLYTPPSLPLKPGPRAAAAALTQAQLSRKECWECLEGPPWDNCQVLHPDPKEHIQFLPMHPLVFRKPNIAL